MRDELLNVADDINGIYNMYEGMNERMDERIYKLLMILIMILINERMDK